MKLSDVMPAMCWRAALRLCVTLMSAATTLGSKNYDYLATTTLPVEYDWKQEKTCNQCYISHPACLVTNEGIGGTTSQIHPILDIAMRHNMKLICQKTDFDTGSSSHHTGNLGYLFGCDFRAGQAKASGLAAAITDLPKNHDKLQVRLTNAGQFWMGVLGMHTLGDEKVVIKDNTFYEAVSWKVRESKDYHAGDFVNYQDCPTSRPDEGVSTYTRMEAYRQSYKWFRHQWHFIRQKDPKRQVSACQDTSKPYSIVLHIRLGDYTYTLPVDKYVAALDAIFAGQVKGAHFTQESSVITVLAETAANDTKMEPFRKYKNLKFLAGMPEEKRGDATPRLIRDLDCMSMSDLLIVSNGGFSGLGSAIQKDGAKTYVMDIVQDKGRFDSPNSNTSPRKAWLAGSRMSIKLSDTAIPSVKVFSEELQLE